jgi:hypothetical protein
MYYFIADFHLICIIETEVSNSDYPGRVSASFKILISYAVTLDSLAMA